MTAILEGAEPFLLPGSSKGILLIHGFTGSPAEMVLLGRSLQEKGYTVLAPRLCGHGTSPEEMASTNWRNWYHSVCDGYHLLKGLCTEISVVGLSMGGLLAIKIGMEYPVHKVVTLSAPIHIADRRIELLPEMEQAMGRYVSKRRRKIADLPDRYCVAYRQMPLASIHSLLALIRSIVEGLGTLSKPLLIIQSRSDHTVLPESGQYIYEHVASEEKELLWLAKSGHLVTLDVERERVFEKVAAFIG